MSRRAPISRPLFSMRRMISPMSLRRTPSPFTSTRVSSKARLLLIRKFSNAVPPPPSDACFAGPNVAQSVWNACASSGYAEDRAVDSANNILLAHAGPSGRNAEGRPERLPRSRLLHLSGSSPAYLLAAALVGGAVRAGFPLHIERLLAVDAGLLEVPVAHGADQEVLLHQVATVGAEHDIGPELPFEHSELQLALARLLQVLRRANDQVDQGPHVGEDDSHDPPEDAHRPAPTGVCVGPVDERNPQDDEQEQHELAHDPQQRAL